MKTKVACFYLLILLPFIFPGPSFSQIPSWIWAKQAGSTSSEGGLRIKSGQDGFLYATGNFSCCGFIYGNDTLTNSTYDYFLAKYDSDGNVKWARNEPGTAVKQCAEMAIRQDKIIVTGYFSGSTAYFGNDTLINNGSQDIFIAEYDTSGNILWAKRFGNTGSDNANGINFDNQGNIYLTGSFNSSNIAFDSITLQNPGLWTCFYIAKFDSSGNVIWAKTTYGDVWGNSVVTDSFGNVYVTGGFDGPAVTFNSVYIDGNCLISSCNDFYILKYDSMGNELWGRGVGGSGTGSVMGYSLAVDAIDNVYVTGVFYSSLVIFDTDSLNGDPASNYDGDVFVAKYDPSGNLKWAKRAGTPSHDRGNNICIDEANDVYLTGAADGFSFDFDTSNVSGNFFGGFVAKCNKNNGAMQWVKPLAGTGFGICADPEKFVYATGNFKLASTPFDSFILSNTGPGSTTDIFVAKLDSSIASLNNPVVTASSIPASCFDSCDGEATASAVDGNPPYTYQWDASSGNQTSATAVNLCAGTYSVTVTDSNNLTSTTTVTVSQPFPIDVGVTNNLNILTADNNAATSYTWLDCNNNFAVIPGANSQTYNPASNGNYAVIVVEGTCSDTSACIVINTLSGDELSRDNYFIFPNPNSGKIKISAKNSYSKGIQLEIVNSLGVLVYENSLLKLNEEIDLDFLSNGTYYLRIKDENNFEIQKLVLLK